MYAKTFGWPKVLPNDYGIRPAGKPDECFYCYQRVGQAHRSDCVTVLQLVRYTVRVNGTAIGYHETDQPYTWSVAKMQEAGPFALRQRVPADVPAGMSHPSRHAAEVIAQFTNPVVTFQLSEVVDPGPVVSLREEVDEVWVRPRPALVQTGDFTLASGAKSTWKLECDALTPADWAGLAAVAVQFLPTFCHVEGVPRGGLPFAAALAKYATPDSPRLLVAEDVCTTGGSITRFLEAYEAYGSKARFTEAVGVCVFCRDRHPHWVTPLFRMPRVISTPDED